MSYSTCLSLWSRSGRKHELALPRTFYLVFSVHLWSSYCSQLFLCLLSSLRTYRPSLFPTRSCRCPGKLNSHLSVSIYQSLKSLAFIGLYYRVSLLFDWHRCSVICRLTCFHSKLCWFSLLRLYSKPCYSGIVSSYLLSLSERPRETNSQGQLLWSTLYERHPAKRWHCISSVI